MSSSVNVERDYTTFINYVNKGYASNVEINKDESTLKMYVRPSTSVRSSVAATSVRILT